MSGGWNFNLSSLTANITVPQISLGGLSQTTSKLSLSDEFHVESNSPWATNAAPFRVYTISSPDCFLIQDLTDESKPVISIERASQPDKAEVQPGKCAHRSIEEMKTLLKGYVNSVDVYGFFGVMKLPSGNYLVGITQVEPVACIMTHNVYLVTDTVLIPFAEDRIVDPVERQNLEKSLMEVKKWLNTNFYFSYKFNITTSIKEQQKASEMELWAQADPRFFWNRHISHYFIKNKLSSLILPLMKGFFQSSTCQINGHIIQLVLVSRISCLRVGTRFNIRGVNDDGNVANFVETEQIVVSGDKIASFIQVRGSVPLFWEQKMVRGKYRPSISRGAEAAAPAFQKHFEDMIGRYGKQYIVNLLGKKDEERLLGEAYEQQLQMLASPNIQYKAFDFHEMLGSTAMKFHMIGSLLLDSLQPDLLKFGVYALEKGKQILDQKGAFRTNCMDCLDRTNLCQWQISKRALVLTLQLLQVIPSVTNYDSCDELISSGAEEVHKLMWANNGDSISMSYTGTGALKSALTRNGKMTITGLVSDSLKSLQRTYQNYYLDNEKQEIIDFFLGNKSEQVEDEQDWLAIQLKARQAEFMDKDNLVVFIGTYNVGGNPPGESLDGWLGNLNPSPSIPDVYVIGFQEVVGLTGKSVWNADISNTQVWQKMILDYISQHNKYVLLRYYQLVGVVLSVFVRQDQINNYREVHSEIAKVGFKGIAGNKGAITIRFNYHQSSFAFTCAHLAAGQNNVEERNRDYQDIISSTSFRLSKGRVGILDHDYVFFFGDLNYRINGDYAEIRKNINAKKWDALIENDQLTLEMRAGNVLKGFYEGSLTFPPTYKYDMGTDIYDTSEKRRAPAWCDRVLFRITPKIDLQQYNYKYGVLTTSDHKPVSSIFRAGVKVINKEKFTKVQTELLKSMEHEGGSQPPSLVDWDAIESPQVGTFSSVENTPQPALFDPFGDSPQVPQQSPQVSQQAAGSNPFTDLFNSPSGNFDTRKSGEATPSTNPFLTSPIQPTGVMVPQKTPPALPPKQSPENNRPPPLPPKNVGDTPFGNFGLPQSTDPFESLGVKVTQIPPLPPKPANLQAPEFLRTSMTLPPTPTQPLQPTPPTQPMQPMQPLQPQPMQPLQPTQPLQPLQPTQPTQPMQPLQPQPMHQMNSPFTQPQPFAVFPPVNPTPQHPFSPPLQQPFTPPLQPERVALPQAPQPQQQPATNNSDPFAMFLSPQTSAHHNNADNAGGATNTPGVLLPPPPVSSRTRNTRRPAGNNPTDSFDPFAM